MSGGNLKRRDEPGEKIFQKERGLKEATDRKKKMGV